MIAAPSIDRIALQQSKLWRIFLQPIYGLLLLFVLIALFAPLISTHDPIDPDPANKLKPPSAEHWFGTNFYGMDIFSRVLYATRTDFAVALTSVMLGVAVGVPLRNCSHRTFQAGDPVDVDLSGQHSSYNSDTARMVFVGQPSGEVERMYRITLEAYEATLEKIRPGVCVADIHHVCAGYMAKHGYEQVWKVGHGVGLGPVHEAPLLEAGSELVLEPGMVFTVDPGCFMTGGYKDLPIHIEDNILVTSDGAVSISSYTLDMVVV